MLAWSRYLTLFFSLIVVLSFSLYSCFLMGTLFHELNHKSHSRDTIAIQVNYDGTGMTKAHFIGGTEAEANLQGNIVMVFLMLLVTLSTINILGWKNEINQKVKNEKEKRN